MRALLLHNALRVAVALVLCELALGWLAPQRTLARVKRNQPAMYQASDYLPYALRPGSHGRLRAAEFDVAIDINESGYRGPELRSDPEAFRILVIGDSMTFGWGVESDETYARRLEAHLAGRNVEVVNAGFRACYYPGTYYLYLKEEGLALEPDLIVVGFFIANDIDHAGAHRSRWTEVDDAGLPLAIVNTEYMVDANFWVSRRRLLRYAVPGLRDSQVFQLLAAQVPQLANRPLGAAPSIAKAGNLPFVFKNPWEPRTEQAAEDVKRLFLGMQEVAGDTPLVVAILPPLFQLKPRILKNGGVRAQQVFSRFFRRNGIESVDLLPALLKQPDREALYFPRDQHWTPAGHDFAARQIARFLLERRLVPARRAGG